MVFSSVVFLFAFLPITLAIYFVIPNNAAKNVVLLVASLFFYAWGEPIYVFLMIASIIINWFFAQQIGNTDPKHFKRIDATLSKSTEHDMTHASVFNEDDGFDSLDTPINTTSNDSDTHKSHPLKANVMLVCALIFNIGALGVFKYATFVIDQLNRIFSNALPDFELALPIGISFYTLQAISYVVDVWRGDVKAQKNPLYLGMYISMFPQLIAGPIVRYQSIENEIKNRHVSLAGFSQGIRLFIIGLGKKVLLANTSGILADSLLVQTPEQIGFIGCFSAIAAYTFQIYFDFGGYSDMAIGLGRMFGFSYPRNFNYPYISQSVTEFWRRWHMSLGSFFRDYVYIPLGGNRASKSRWMLNLVIVWGLTGIWHGAAWNFLIWGLYYGFILMLEKIFLLKLINRAPHWLRHVYVIMVFFFGWAIFSVTGGLSNLYHWFLGLIGHYGLLGTSTLFELQSWSYVSLLPILIVASTPIIPWLRKHLEQWLSGLYDQIIIAAPERGNNMVPPCELSVECFETPEKARIATAISIGTDLCLLAVFIMSVITVASSAYNPFIYFQF